MEDLIKAITNLFKIWQPKKTQAIVKHDYFYVDINPELVSKEDIKELDKLGFFVDEEYDGEGFGSFRYGSC
jgi:hypothetical protein